MLDYNMLLTFNINDIYDSYIILCDPIKNTVIENSKFIRIIYSDKLVTTNGIYIIIPFQDIRIDNNFNNKYKCSFDIEKNKQLLKQINDIEKLILNKVVLSKNKAKTYKLSENIYNGNIKVFNETDNISNIILKISGIWEDNYSYGLTYKFITS